MTRFSCKSHVIGRPLCSFFKDIALAQEIDYCFDMLLCRCLESTILRVFVNLLRLDSLGTLDSQAVGAVTGFWESKLLRKVAFWLLGSLAIVLHHRQAL